MIRVRPVLLPFLLVLGLVFAGCVAPDAPDDPDATPSTSPSPTPPPPSGAATPPASPTPPVSPSPSPSPSPDAEPVVHTVAIGRNIKGAAADYAPDPVRIAVGDSVRWKNEDSFTHTATGDDDAFDTGPLGGGATSDAIVFDTAGTYTYYCAAHPETMKGAEVIVS